MKKTLLALAIAAGLTSFVGSAKAGLTYNWSMAGSGNYQSSTDVVGGQLTLNDAGTQATSAYVTSDIGGNVHFDRSINLVDYVSNSSPNTFTVENGKITTCEFVSLGNKNPIYHLYFNVYGSINIYATVLSDGDGSQIYNNNVNNFRGMDGISFTPVTAVADTAAVPEPSQVAASLLLVGGIAGFVIVKRRKEASALEALAA